eukprot:TRINITY_DN10618_c0_g1_i1.p2 TRINITY_DN10618_c0_g1~~TRINITY_DN10618_c0_g1_i1.p2  ORF type:complete len:161 (-),score=16.33 TRINITY_DN10618_c0_g1_i1:1709-2191(-)
MIRRVHSSSTTHANHLSSIQLINLLLSLTRPEDIPVLQHVGQRRQLLGILAVAGAMDDTAHLTSDDIRHNGCDQANSLDHQSCHVKKESCFYILIPGTKQASLQAPLQKAVILVFELIRVQASHCIDDRCIIDAVKANSKLAVQFGGSSWFVEVVELVRC